MNKTLKISFIIVLIIAVLLALFYFIGGEEKPTQKKLSSTNDLVVDSDTNNVENDIEINNDTSFLETLEYLKSMKIEAGIFLSSSFKSLKDNTVTIESDGVIGRENPFAPIAGMEQSLNLVPVIQSADASNQNNTNALSPKN